MIWGILGGFIVGGIFGVMLACIMCARKDDEK